MEISLKAYGKINLSLDITGKRNDGYHTLESVMQTVSLFDVITVTANNSGEISVECNGINGEDNICFLAAKRFFEKTKLDFGVNIKIDKAIPVSAGMGGGSTDAAAVLNALNKLYGYPLNEASLCEIALSLGADVPFFIRGGTATAMGIGEILKPIENKLSYALVLIKEGKKPSTKYMYEQIDSNNEKKKTTYTSSLIKAIKSNDFNAFANSIGNDFDLLWDNEKIKADLYNLGAYKVCLSGSGPTVFGIFENISAALSAAAVLRASYNQVYTAVPTDNSFDIE